MTDLNAEMAFLQSMQTGTTDSYLPKPTTSNAEAENENEEEEDDYDPSDLSYDNSSYQNASNQNVQASTVPRDAADAGISANTSTSLKTLSPNLVTETKPAATKQPRTIGGFVVDDDDEDDDDGAENEGEGDGEGDSVESGSRLEAKPVGEELGNVNGHSRPASASRSLPRRSASRTPQGAAAQGIVSAPQALRERTSSLDVSKGVANSNNVNVATVTVPISDNAASTEKKPVSDPQPSSVSLSRGPSAQGSVETSVSKARLPHDRVGILEDRIAEDPKGDIDAWLSLINEHRRRNKVEDARLVYERFFKIFPTAVCTV